MPNPASRLPARPSLEQLRKQAKELSRADNIPLAEAHFRLAKQYGFESWPKLVHHVEALRQSGRLEQYQRLAEDLLEAYQSGDPGAVQRLNDAYGGSFFTGEQLRANVQDRIGTTDPGAFTLAVARRFIARLYGFEDWDKFAASIAQPDSDPRSAPLGMSSTPPFYKIDWTQGTIEPRPPLSSKDWDRIFAVMKEHRLTGLASGAVTDSVMERLPELDHVTNLNLGGAKQLTDTGLLHLARMPWLQRLDLSDYPGGKLTDHGLEVLRHLAELRRFQMCWYGGISDAGVAHLTFCDRLESVNLLGTPTGDGAINALRGKRGLRHFTTGRLVTDAGLPLLHDFPVFKRWQGGESRFELMSPDAEPNHLTIDGPFTEQGLAELVGLDGLFGLTFFWHTSRLAGDGLGPLAGLPNLGFLGCQDNLCNDDAMRHIGALPRLRMLMGQGTVAGDAGFAALSRSQTIEYIWGRECPNLGSRGFVTLATMPALKGLAVSCKNVDDAALSALPRFPALRGLMPMDVSDDGFRHVGGCERLEDLWCMYCRDTGDIATGHIAGLSRLKTYYAGKTRITDRSLEILGRMHSLEKLEFFECAGLTDSGLAHLAGLPRLRKVSVGGSTKVSRDGMSVFPAGVRAEYW